MGSDLDSDIDKKLEDSMGILLKIVNNFDKCDTIEKAKLNSAVFIYNKMYRTTWYINKAYIIKHIINKHISYIIIYDNSINKNS